MNFWGIPRRKIFLFKFLATYKRAKPNRVHVQFAAEAFNLAANLVIVGNYNAVWHGVPIVENKPLARVLFRTTEVGSQIPYDLYKAVAEILAYVYRLKRKSV